MFEMWFNYFAKDETLPVFIQFGAHEKYMFPHEHVDFYELVLVMKGSAEHIAGDRRMKLEKGDVFVMNPGSCHAYENAVGLHICNIMFRPDMLFMYETDLSQLEGFQSLFSADSSSDFRSFLKLSPNDYDEAERLVHLLEKEYFGSGSGRNALITAYFTELIVNISRLYGRPVKKREINVISRAAVYLEEHYMTEQPIKTAIELSNYSRRHFTRLFSEVYGISPQDYLLEVRMKNAALLLRKSGASIAEAALKCGFSDPGYFSRTFKKRYGVLPSRYRAGKDL